MEKPSNNLFVPYVVEQTANGTKTSDIFSRLLEDRIVILNGEVTQESCNLLMSQLLFLNGIDNSKPIFLYISSPGGSVMNGLGQVIDVMNFISAPVYTIATGIAASMGAAILSAGEKGHRYCLPSSQILVHPQSGGVSGRTNDNMIEMVHERRLQEYLMATIAFNCGKISEKEFQEIKDMVERIRIIDPDSSFSLSKETKKDFEAFKKECSYDHWMFPKEALEFGIIDAILNKETGIN